MQLLFFLGTMQVLISTIYQSKQLILHSFLLGCIILHSFGRVYFLFKTIIYNIESNFFSYFFCLY